MNEIEMNLLDGIPNKDRSTKWLDESFASYHRKTQMAGAYFMGRH